MLDLDVFAESIRSRIPLTRHLDFRLLEWDRQTLRLRAGLAANVNDKGSLFAGSQAALMTMAGWAYSVLLAEEEVDVVAARAEISFQVPIYAEVEITAYVKGVDRERFSQRLKRKGKAPLAVTVTARELDGQLASRYLGHYLVTCIM